jgi:putative chitinase
MKAWHVICRLADNASSIWEGFLIFCIYGGGGLLVGFGGGIAWSRKEIADSWSFPLEHGYPDNIEDEGKMTPSQLATATGARIDRATEFLPHIEGAAPDFEINTPERMAAFLAQVGHESGGLHWLTELWGPTATQTRYEGRADLGNTQEGDGFKYRGRGLIQLTGRANYQKASDALATDFIGDPDQLAQPEYAVRSAMWFWQSHGLNELADAGDFDRITRIINGGTNGAAERLALWDAAKEVLA